MTGCLVLLCQLQVKFRDFIPSILNVSRQCLASGDEDVAVIAFEIFDELIESPAPLLGDSVRSIVQFSLEVCSSENLESNTRHQVGKDLSLSVLLFYVKSIVMTYLSNFDCFNILSLISGYSDNFLAGKVQIQLLEKT